MHLYQYTESELTEFANQVKEALLVTLHLEGEFSSAKADELAGSHAVIVHKKGFLGKWWDKVHGNDSDEKLYVSVIKSALPPDEVEEA